MWYAARAPSWILYQAKVLGTWKIKAEIKINKANKKKIPEWNGQGMAPQGPVRTVRYCFSACARYIVLSVLYLISFLKSHWKQCCLLLFCGWWLSVCVYFHVMLNFSAFYANKYAQFNQNKVVEHEKLNVFKRNGFFLPFRMHKTCQKPDMALIA